VTLSSTPTKVNAFSEGLRSALESQVATVQA
jgi:hypothetical protein